MTMRDKLRYAALSVIVLLVLLFICFNLEAVDVNIIIANIRMRKAFVIIGSFMAGAGVILLWGLLKPKFKGSGDPDAWKK
ncbi:MAG: hypothetical protein AAB074_12465 [Planctomycetota bacterium]